MEKKIAIWLKTFAWPNASQDGGDGRKPQHEPDAACRDGARDARPGVRGEFISEQVFRASFVSVRGPMPTANRELRQTCAPADEADQTGPEHDQGEGHVQEEDADERRGGETQHDLVLECALADPAHSLDHDGKHGGFEPEEQRRNESNPPVSGVDDAERKN